MKIIEASLFEPYVVKKHIEQEFLELELPKKLRITSFVLFRVYPFLLLGLLSISFLFTNAQIPLLYISILSIVVIVLFILLVIKKYPVFISIKKNSIEITEKQFAKTVLHTISCTEIEKISCYESVGRGGGTYFKLILKNGKKISLFNIPLLQMNKNKTLIIIDILKEITQIEIVIL